MAGSGMAYETVHLNRWVWRALDILESKPQESLELARQAPALTESIGFFHQRSVGGASLSQSSRLFYVYLLILRDYDI